MATRNEIGEMIRANRDKQGLTKEEMAELVGVEVYKIYSLEDGKDYLNKNTRESINALLDITLPPLSINNPAMRQEMYLGDVLFKAREFNNHSQLEAAVVVGCCEGSIYTWEAGKPCNSTTRKLILKYVKDTEDRLAKNGTPIAILETTEKLHQSQGIISVTEAPEHPPKEVKVEAYTRTKVGTGQAGKKKKQSQAAYRKKQKDQLTLLKKNEEPEMPRSPEDIVHEALQAAHKEKDLRDIVTIAVSIDQKKLKTIANYARHVKDAKPLYLGEYHPSYYTEE